MTSPQPAPANNAGIRVQKPAPTPAPARGFATATWIAGLIACLATMVALFGLTQRALISTGAFLPAVSTLKDGDLPPGLTALGHLRLAGLALSEKPPRTALAEAAARKAIAQTPSNGWAWFRLAEARTLAAKGAPDAESIAALRRSMAACPACDDTLVRGRLAFVIASWPSIPEDLRAEAFRHADKLRWSFRHADFLAEMRARALESDIPFDRMRGAVQTPVQAWEIATVARP